MTTVLPQKNNFMIGAAYMLTASVSFAILGGLVRELSADMHPFVIVFWRTALALVILVPILWGSGSLRDLKSKRLGLQFLNGAFFGFMLLANFYALSTIPLADTVSYSFAAPIFTTICAAIFLGEKIRLPRIMAIIFGFIGMLVLLQPGVQPLSLGVIAALSCAVAISISVTLVRVLARTEKPQVITFYALVLTLPANLVFALPVWSWPSRDNLLLVLVMGVLAAIIQLCFSKAIAEAEASAMMPLDYTRLVFSALIGYFFFDEQPQLNTYVGAVIIMASVLYAAHRERLEARRKKEKPAPAPTA
ncbi:DMT family transporter [Emcibacter nanhaiensis]|uniref:DMT family transporter n=1 Tax=Emcibacter nanhaiensis TaxID=1505037 RepID=A0A501PB87_9PROT|nr:DMT family transporter [Emcibacter nanhaiensis]TPD57351.1 DMT family transporter [Emcibacter nanhaiensis]